MFLLGTAHVSKQSCDEVKELINCVKPKAVFVELCEQRAGVMVAQPKEFTKKMSYREMLQRYAKGDADPFSLLYSTALVDVSNSLEVLPGGEFRAAHEAASKLGIPVLLGDRHIGITVSRLWHGLSIFQKAMLIFGFLSEYAMFSMGSKDKIRDTIEQFKNDKDMLTEAMDMMGDRLPWVVEVLVHERDRFMTLELRQMLLEMGDDEDIVAVVGAGHLPGMRREWAADTEGRSDDEAQQLYHNLQLYPNSDTNTGDFVITLDELRAYAAQVAEQYYKNRKQSTGGNI